MSKKSTRKKTILPSPQSEEVILAEERTTDGERLHIMEARSVSNHPDV